jgi:hypothetical protein
VPEQDTLEEIDAAILLASGVPEDHRGAAWWAFMDKLLDQRKAAESA